MEVLIILLSLPLMMIGGFALDGLSNRGDDDDDAGAENEAEA
jgi:hypothetical protein